MKDAGGRWRSHSPRMRILTHLALATLAVTATFAADYSRVIFTDDFSAEGFGKRWGHY